MRFHKYVTKEVRVVLLEQLKEYESAISMSKEERKELRNWVATGRSPYDNGNYICGAGGYPLDFIRALRAEKELQDWFDSLSEVEKLGYCYQYSTDTDEVYFDMGSLPLPDAEECGLPF